MGSESLTGFGVEAARRAGVIAWSGRSGSIAPGRYNRPIAVSSFSSSLRSQGTALLAIGLGGFVADYALNVGLSRVLSVHEFGDFRVARSFAAFFGVAVLLGGDRAAPKALAGPLIRGESEPVWGYLRFYLGVAMALSAVVMASTWTVSLLHVGATDPEHHHAVAWVVLSVPITAVGALASRGLQSARLQAAAALPWRIGHPLLSLGAIFITAWALGGLTVEQAILLTMAVVALITAWQWRRLRVLVPEVESPARAPRTPRRWLATSMPMMGAFLVAIALNESDLYLLELLGDENEVGHYAAAATAVHFLMLVQTTVIGLFAPLLQPAIEDGVEASIALRRRVGRTMIAAILPAAVVMVLVRRPVLALFGPTYQDAEPVLVVLVVAFASWALAAPDVLWLQYTGRGARVIVISAVALAADTALNVVLIPAHGMRGAAFATAMTLALAAIALRVVAHRSPPPSAVPRSAWRHAVPSAPRRSGPPPRGDGRGDDP